MGYEPLHHKYRPQRFEQLVGQEPIARTLCNALLSNRIAPAYLFTGSRGTGKTSSARILARSLNCLAEDRPTPEPCGRCALCCAITAGNALDVIEIDAASNTGVDNIRELIERARFAPVQARWKVYVVDECHMLSTAAFNALLKTLEEPPPRVVFVLATTDPQRVLPTIISRCQRFDFRRIPTAAMERHLAFIAAEEGIGITPEAIRLVAQLAQGGLRDAESLLDQLSLLPAPVDEQGVWELMGAVPELELLALAEALVEQDPLRLLEVTRQLLDRGREPPVLLQGLAALLRDLLLAGVAPERQDLSAISAANWPRLPPLARRLGREHLLQLQKRLSGSEVQLRHSAQPRLWLEVLLLGLLAAPESAAPASHRSGPGAAVAAGTGSSSPAAATGAAGTASHPAAAVTAATASAAPPPARITTPSPPTPAPPAQAPSRAPASGPTAAGSTSLPPRAVSGAAAAARPGPVPMSESGLQQQWQRILACLELPATRMLLSQQGRLMQLDDRRITIQVAPAWIAMVQSRLPLLEKAVTTALGSPRQVVLGGAAAPGRSGAAIPSAVSPTGSAAVASPPPELPAVPAKAPQPFNPAGNLAEVPAPKAGPATAPAAGYSSGSGVLPAQLRQAPAEAVPAEVSSRAPAAAERRTAAAHQATAAPGQQPPAGQWDPPASEAASQAGAAALFQTQPAGRGPSSRAAKARPASSAAQTAALAEPRPQARPAPPPAQPSASVSPPRSGNTSIDMAARSLATLFNGEVVVEEEEH